MNIQEMKAERDRLGRLVEQMQKDLLSVRASAKEIEHSIAHTQGAIAMLDRVVGSSPVAEAVSMNGTD